MADDIIAEVEKAAEEIVEFPFRPGGLIDRHRQDQARRDAILKQREQAAEQIEEDSYKAVKTVDLSPEIISAQTFSITPLGNTPIAPGMEYRSALTVMLVPIAAQTPLVILAKDSGQAISGLGFTLSAGVPVRIRSRAQLYAFNPSGSLTIQVSVLAEIFAPEE